MKEYKILAEKEIESVKINLKKKKKKKEAKC